MFKQEKGVTLVALVITIVILLILAGVSMAGLTGQNGLLTRAQQARNLSNEGAAEENEMLKNTETLINGLGLPEL
jgi:type II secretory pathway pseudopilin PulG